MTEPTQGAMAQLLAQEDARPIPKVGDLVTGRILTISKNEAHLDIDGFTTGIVRGRELFDESGETADLKVGDDAVATVLELENETGQMELSFRTAGHRKAWDKLIELRDKGTIIEVTVTDANRGGLMVKVDRVGGFLPVSQLMSEHYPRVEGGDKQRILELLQKLTGEKIKVRVIDVNEKDEKLIVSEKAAWEDAQRERLGGFEVGQVVKGKITGIVDFGAFMEFDTGLEGLIHISELAWQRLDHPKDIVQIGQEMEAKIIGLEGTKVSLSVKQLQPDPWKAAVEKYQVGQVVKGKVLRLNSFGAFVELDEQIQGLCHISELSHKQIKHPSEAVKEGQMVEFQILSIDAEEHRLGLSKKVLEFNDEADKVEKEKGEVNAPAAEAPTTEPARAPEPAESTEAVPSEPTPAEPKTDA